MATVDQEFTLLPLQMDPSSKAISCPSLPNDDALTTALTGLNNLHRTLLTLPNTTPPPPVPANPKRSAQINKMREQANTTMKKAANNPSQAQGMLCAWFDFFLSFWIWRNRLIDSRIEAIKLYTFALQIALTRPPVEASGLLREEAALLYSNRAQAYMAASQWPEGAADAQCSVELKRLANGKAWWRRGRCLVEMGRWAEARNWVEEGKKEVEENGEGYRELLDLGKEIQRHLDGRA